MIRVVRRGTEVAQRICSRRTKKARSFEATGPVAVSRVNRLKETAELRSTGDAGLTNRGKKDGGRFGPPS